ncbi:IQ calmodulin-binding- domain protein [Novosphingobium marinum]|uniref:5-methylcytosine-specific restriction enzyme subunit McrC n=1 Tax=Novosphingobium marinum TaxID=1514948 RepID=A0A7Y9XYS1_9SPHN|nr:calmodulin-binding protein [Novosphingobium marinum]NYH97089.1 5-methylcytosine-specific restriction enzyme subunit McrC [Novosphingobium marinum]GGC43481.1 IQ calmodulin-binding- domain protein [Novosphingobium marinum]
MSNFTVREWGQVKLGEGGFTRAQADALQAAACGHPLAHRDGTNILVYHRDRIVARQMVGMVAARGCSLEILPKVDPDAAEDEQAQSVRRRLVRMLDVALGLDLDLGGEAAIHRQNHTLLEVLIRAFADKLLAEVRRGLPRLYRQCEDDLPALRGRLDVTRQFTRNAVRPDRLACRFDQLDADKPLMRVMAAAVVTLGKHARSPETRRKLDELRHVLAEIPLVPVNRLPWKEVRIDRTNRRWESLYRLAQLLLRRDWQATHHAASAPEGLTLLFPMNDLFEKYVAAMMRKALAGSGVEVVDQGGHRACLGAFTGEHLESGEVFRTRPDIILRRRGEVLAIIDTKWKKLARDPLDRKHGVSQADVYQLMAYARLYPTRELMLLYPEVPGQPCGMRKPFGMAGGSERLAIATIDASLEENAIVRHLAKLCRNYCAEMDSAVT